MPDPASVTLVTLSFKIIGSFPHFFYVIDFVYASIRGEKIILDNDRGITKSEI